MPQTITFSKTDPAVNHISVDNDVLVVDSDSITFVNDLNPPNDAEISFYRNARKKIDDDPIKDFCDDGQDVITVAANSTTICTVRNGINNREYVYKIEASPQYVTLDPVVILDRPGKKSFLEDIGPGFLFAAVAITAVAGIAAGMQIGRRMAGSDKQARKN